jgi:hypothetical protein
VACKCGRFATGSGANASCAYNGCNPVVINAANKHKLLLNLKAVKIFIPQINGAKSFYFVLLDILPLTSRRYAFAGLKPVKGGKRIINGLKKEICRKTRHK